MAGQIEGMKGLSAKLALLGTKLGGKTLKQAALLATSPTLKSMKAAIPVGTRGHETYKGRLVAPGFSKRSIRRQSRLRKGKATVTIGVDAEAFYAVLFTEFGTKNMTARPWFKQRFIGDFSAMERAMASSLKKKIDQVAAKR